MTAELHQRGAAEPPAILKIGHRSKGFAQEILRALELSGFKIDRAERCQGFDIAGIKAHEIAEKRDRFLDTAKTIEFLRVFEREIRHIQICLKIGGPAKHTWVRRIGAPPKRCSGPS